VAEFSVASAPALSSKEEDDDKQEDDQIVRPNKEYNICADPVNTLIQACTTYGPRAKCGPRKLLIWPPNLQILFNLLFTLIKTPFEWVKT